MTVCDALEGTLLKFPQAVQESTLAAVARELAETLDSKPGARDTASVAKEMRAVLADLTAMAAVAPEESDPIDELARRRAARVATAEVPDRSAGAGE